MLLEIPYVSYLLRTWRLNLGHYHIWDHSKFLRTYWYDYQKLIIDKNAMNFWQSSGLFILYWFINVLNPSRNSAMCDNSNCTVTNLHYQPVFSEFASSPVKLYARSMLSSDCFILSRPQNTTSKPTPVSGGTFSDKCLICDTSNSDSSSSSNSGSNIKPLGASQSQFEDCKN